MSAAEFMKSFQYGMQLVPAADDVLTMPLQVTSVTANADGSLQVGVGGTRVWRFMVQPEQNGRWMADVQGIGSAALRPLTEAQNARFFEELGDSDEVSGEGEQPR